MVFVVVFYFSLVFSIYSMVYCYCLFIAYWSYCYF